MSDNYTKPLTEAMGRLSAGLGSPCLTSTSTIEMALVEYALAEIAELRDRLKASQRDADIDYQREKERADKAEAEIGELMEYSARWDKVRQWAQSCLGALVGDNYPDTVLEALQAAKAAGNARAVEELSKILETARKQQQGRSEIRGRPFSEGFQLATDCLIGDLERAITDLKAEPQPEQAEDDEHVDYRSDPWDQGEEMAAKARSAEDDEPRIIDLAGALKRSVQEQPKAEDDGRGEDTNPVAAAIHELRDQVRTSIMELGDAIGSYMREAKQ